MTVEKEGLRIGIDVSRANRESHGIPIYTRNLLREFGQMTSDDKFVLFRYPETPPLSFGITDPEYAAIPYSGRYIPWLRIIQEQVFYPIAQKEYNLDVFWHPQNHAQYITPVGYAVSLHDVLPYSRPDLAQDLDSYKERALFASRTRSTVSADQVITVSDFSKREIVRCLGVDPGKISVIHNGIDHSLFKPSGSENIDQRLKDKYDLPDRYLLSVGTYAPHKNLITLVEAFGRSQLPEAGIGFVMVGPKDEIVYTSDHTNLENHINKLGLSNLVRMLPAVSVIDLVDLYQHADFFGIASEYEGFGFPPLESMACGVPVVASNTSSLPEVCGQAALYASPHDSYGFAEHLNDLLDNPILRQKMIDSGIKRANEFNWTITAKKTLEAIKKIGNK